MPPPRFFLDDYPTWIFTFYVNGERKTLGIPEPWFIFAETKKRRTCLPFENPQVYVTAWELIHRPFADLLQPAPLLESEGKQHR